MGIFHLHCLRSFGDHSADLQNFDIKSFENAAPTETSADEHSADSLWWSPQRLVGNFVFLHCRSTMFKDYVPKLV